MGAILSATCQVLARAKKQLRRVFTLGVVKAIVSLPD